MATRRDYRVGELSESAAGADPFALFQSWMTLATGSGLIEPTAAALATCDASGRPSCRMVLLKGADSRGFVVFTNFESRKAREMEGRGRAALTLWWDKLERQVRIEGTVERVSDAESDLYHASRPRPSQLAAWASPQSRPIADRAELVRREDEIAARFSTGEVPRPPHWGGYRIVPDAIEFWQGRRDRLHDRILFTTAGEGSWTRTRLAP